MVSVMPATEPPATGGQNKLDNSPDNNKDAVELIRAKINTLYAQEPNPREEAAEAEVARPRSKHQRFMHELSTSGKSLAQIQTEWHNYYVGLNDAEKHEVWREFYAKHGKPVPVATSAPAAPEHHTPGHHAPAHQPAARHESKPADLKRQLLNTVTSRAKVSAKHKHHLKSLGFGLGMGTLVLVIMLFGFFNERFIAPFITPSRTISSTPIITDVTSAEAVVSPNSVIIIPKINIEIPVVYDEPSIDEAAVQRALERGVLWYPTTSQPGEQGNVALFGHSSGNIFNNGRYKFAFVLLNRLEIGDTFMIQKDGKRYVYKVFERKIIPPTEISILNPRDRPTATLVTCDPPGTDLNRLAVIGEQISPDPSVNIASSAPTSNIDTPETLPSNAPTLWGRVWGWLNS